MLKSSINFNNENMVKESQNNIKKIQEKINKSEIDDLNICILERNEININSNIKKYQEFFIKNPDEKLELNNDNLILVYFYLYNKISTQTQNILNKINIEKITAKNDIEEIRNFVTKIIDATKKQVVNFNNINIKKLFYLPIFKNLFNRLYYVRMYSYYLEGRYKECLTDYQEYHDEKIKVAYELETPKSNEYIQKIVGDCYFKINDYKNAEIIFENIINAGTKDPLIYFNLGLSAYLNNKIQKALEKLEQCVNMYKTENKNKDAKNVEEFIAKIKNEK
jgi:TolA-binding protein